MTALRAARVRLLVLGVVGVAVGEVLTWFLLRSQGNDLGGDQAHYLIAGQALRHLSLNMAPDYRADFLSHAIFNWPPAATVTNHAIVQTYPGPHGSVFAHGLGLPLLLSPFLAVGSVPFGLLGLFTIVALGFVCIHQRACTLAGLGRRGQLLSALFMAAPALWLASTQVYPDLLSGVLLAMALLERALVEQRRRLSPFGAVVLAGTLGFVPWLQVKNLAPALCCLIVLVVLAIRCGAAPVVLRRRRRRPARLGPVGRVQPVLLRASGRLAAAQPHLHPDHRGADAGPALRRAPGPVRTGAHRAGRAGRLVGGSAAHPLTALAALIGSLSMVVINGTYTSGVPFGGTALAGRFEWTVLPMLLAWVPLCLAAWERRPRRQLALGLAVAALWLAQGLPIVLGDHTYVNAMIAPFAPWDPTLYPGWWPFIGRWLPTFLAPGLRLGATWARLFFELALGALAWALLVGLARERPLRPPIRTAVVAGLLAAGLAAGLLLPQRTQPSAPLAFAGADLGAPWSAAGQPMTTPPLALAEVGPGTYRVSLSYAPNGGASDGLAAIMATPVAHVVVSGWFTPSHPTDAALLHTAVPPLAAGTGPAARLTLLAAAGRHDGSVRLSVTHDSVLSFFVTVGAGSAFAASSLTITKLAS